MDGTKRIDVLEGKGVLILGNLLAGNVSAQDLCEDIVVIVGHHFSSLWK